MQLNNKTTGQIAIINKWNFQNCTIDVFESGIMLLNNIKCKTLAYKIALDLNVSVNPSPGTIENEIRNLIYTQLLSYPELDGYELSNDSNNWLLITRPIRVSIDRELALEALHEDNALGQLFDSMKKPLKDFIISNENTLTLYLEELYPQHKTILEQHPEKILIETKI